jgi:hypothetical protein
MEESRGDSSVWSPPGPATINAIAVLPSLVATVSDAANTERGAARFAPEPRRQRRRDHTAA